MIPESVSNTTAKKVLDPEVILKNLSTVKDSDEADKALINNANSVVDIDVGNLLAFDPRPIDSLQFKKNQNEHIKEICKISTQLLINQLFILPVDRVDDVLVAKLPKGVTIIPREKPLPKEKPLTKWEQYAKMKGIKKTKKSRMVYDENTKEWRPTWGYNRKNDTTKDWLIEIGKNEDPNQDFFAKRTQAKNERVAKNELQRLRNIARGSKKKVPGVGMTPNMIDESKPEKIQLKKALNMAKRSDASMSKFSEKLKTEDKVTKGFGKKRKFESNYGDMKSEKEKQIRLLEKLSSNKDKSSKEKLNIEKATNKQIAEDNNNNSLAKKKKGGKHKRSLSGQHKRVSVKSKGKPRRKIGGKR